MQHTFNIDSICGDSRFILNPNFRLRDEESHMILYGNQGLGLWPLHHSYGIALSLCDGKRRFHDIVRSVRSFVDEADDEVAYQSISDILRPFFYSMTLTREEQKGSEPMPKIYPSDAPLLLIEDYRKLFSGKKYFDMNYDPKEFLPKGKHTPAPSTSPHCSIPLSLGWHLTSECTTDCRYCYLGRRSIIPMPFERAKHIVHEAATLGIFGIDLLGGDVLLYPYLVALLDEMHQNKFLPTTISTKSFLSRNLAKDLEKVSELFTDIQFSIDTDDEQIASYLVGVSDYPNRIFNSIENAVDVGLTVVAKVVITPYNVLTVPRLYRKLKERGVSAIRLAAYARSGYHHSDDLFLNSQCYAWLNTEVEKLQQEYPGDRVTIQNGQPIFEPVSREIRKEAWNKKSLCTAGRTVMTICADGKVIPCEQMPETEEYFCGDVSHQSIMDVWNGDRLKEMTYGMPREKFQGAPCYDCEEREECHNVVGYCIRDLAAHYGSIYQPPPNCYRHDLPFVRMT